MPEDNGRAAAPPSVANTAPAPEESPAEVAVIGNLGQANGRPAAGQGRGDRAAPDVSTTTRGWHRGRCVRTNLLRSDTPAQVRVKE
jgi:hypothetical protein